MGQAHTKELVAQGWPAFLTGEDVTRLRHTHGVTKHLWGVEVRRGETRVSYAQLRTKKVWYQRVDDSGQMLKYPEAMAAHELPAGKSLPFTVCEEAGVGAGVVQVSDADDGTRATYQKTPQGWWKKTAEVTRTENI